MRTQQVLEETGLSPGLTVPVVWGPALAVASELLHLRWLERDQPRLGLGVCMPGPGGVKLGLPCQPATLEEENCTHVIEL